MAENAIDWLVDKGDLIWPQKDIRVVRRIKKRFSRDSAKNGSLRVVIRTHSDKKEPRPVVMPANGLGEFVHLRLVHLDPAG